MPSRPRNRPDGYAPTVSKIALDIDGNLVDLPTFEYLQSLETEVNEAAGGKMTITLFDPDQDVLEDVIIGLRKNIADRATAPTGPDVENTPPKVLTGRRIQVQFGWDIGGTAEFPIYPGTIASYEPAYAPEGTTLVIHAVSTAVVLAALNRKPRAFSEGMKASDIFVLIATDNNWTYIVEETSGTMSALSSNTESDVLFLRNKVLPRAINAAGQSFVLYWDTDGTAHFHSPGFRKDQGQGTEVSIDADYTFGADAWGDVEEFTPSDNSLAAAVFGAGDTTYTGSDSEGGTQTNADATPGVGPMGASVATVGGGVFRPEASPFKHSRIHLPSRSTEEFQQLVAHRWSHIARLSYKAHMKVKGTHAMRVGGYIRVRRYRRDGREHHLSGVFMVTSVKQSFGQGWSTEVEIVRPGTGNVPGATAATSVTSKAPLVDADTQTAGASEPAGPPENFGEAPVTT